MNLWKRKWTPSKLTMLSVQSDFFFKVNEQQCTRANTSVKVLQRPIMRTCFPAVIAGDKAPATNTDKTLINTDTYLHLTLALTQLSSRNNTSAPWTHEQTHQVTIITKKWSTIYKACEEYITVFTRKPHNHNTNPITYHIIGGIFQIMIYWCWEVTHSGTAGPLDLTGLRSQNNRYM